MKQKVAYLSILFLMVMNWRVQAQNYDKQWEKVMTSIEKSLPKSAWKQAETIYKQAEKEQNVAQMMKAYLVMMSCREEISPDSFYVDVKGLDEWVRRSTDEVEKAILHFILADVMTQRVKGYYDYRQEKTIDGFPEDIHEWTSLHYARQAMLHYRAALSSVEMLGHIAMKTFEPLWEKGNVGAYYQHDLLHIIGRGAIDALLNELDCLDEDNNLLNGNKEDNICWKLSEFLKTPQKEMLEYDRKGFLWQIYQRMECFYQKEGNFSALVLLDVERLGQMRNLLSGMATASLLGQKYLDGLQYLVDVYGEIDVCAEAYLAMAEALNATDRKVEAMRCLEEALARYPKYKRINALKNLKQQLLKASCSVRFSKQLYPDTPIDLSVCYCNITELTLRIYRVDVPVDSIKEDLFEQKQYRKKHIRLETIQRLQLQPTLDYLPVDTILQIKGLPEGVYLLEAKGNHRDAVSTYELFYVSALKVIAITLFDSQQELVAVDSKTGHPVPEAELIGYQCEWDKSKEVWRRQTDAEGKLLVSANRFNAVRAMKGKDTFMPIAWGYGNSYYGYGETMKKEERIQLFTDRSIYRPGQTVHVAGLVYSKQGDHTQVITNKEFTIELKDSNREKVNSKKVKSNVYGSFTTDFVLPVVCLPGRFCLVLDGREVSFQVEEYKRPSFEVSFDSVQESYQIGDTIEVCGRVKTFSGLAVQQASVAFTVSRSTPWWWRREPQITLQTGEIKTDEEGVFRIPVVLDGCLDDNNYFLWYRNFQVEVEVTDGAGETQQGQINLPVGSVSCYVDTDMPEAVLKEKALPFTISVKNLKSELMSVSGHYTLYEVDSQDKQGRQVGQCKFVSGQALAVDGLLTLPSGRYRMVAVVTDNQGRDAKLEHTFLLFSQDDRHLSCEAKLWHYEVDTEFGPNRDGVLLFGSSLKNVYVLYDVFAGNQRIVRERFLLTDSIIKKTFAYRSEYGDGLTVKVALVKDGDLHQCTMHLVKARPEKKLELKWKVFRDKLLPGQQEQWTLHVAYPDGRPATAELLAVLYDKSLDKLIRHSWPLNLAFQRNLPYVNWHANYVSDCHLSLTFPYRILKVNEWIPDALKAYYQYNGNFQNVVFESESFSCGTIPVMAIGIKKGVMSRSLNVAFDNSEKAEAAEPEEMVEEQGTAVLRSNFAETAFFFPQLQADEKGDIAFSFTLPESLTEWKFMGLAHTQAMDWGQLEASVVARKDFMLKPNMPRFLRQGDVTSIAATLSNLTDKDLEGEIRLELFNPATDKVCYADKKAFVVAGGKMIPVSFQFEVADSWQLLACRMVAESGTFSDGEQHYLPVLTDKIWLTESVPLTITDKGIRKFDLNHLFNGNSRTATERRLTIDFSSNPIWYAIQALPSLVQPTSESAIDWAVMYYANSLATYILQACPQVKTVFDAWLAMGDGSKDLFMSQLEKNQELKNLLLEETPWIAEAKDETERKKRIALLFDVNALGNQTRVVEAKLKSLQLDNGAWAWYKGMNGSRYITQSVVEMLARLMHLTGQPLSPALKTMYDKAVTYIYKEVKDDYKMKKREKEGVKQEQLSESVLQYLYLTALGALPQHVDDANVTDYLVGKMATMNNAFTIYGKARAAFVMWHYGYQEKANEFLNSLKEYAIQTPDGGMFYDTNRAEYSGSSYRIPTQVAVIETMDEVAHDAKRIEQLKLWLLQQKRTQTWNSPLATAHAVYALLLRGIQPLSESGRVQISLNKYRWDTRDGNKYSEVGNGYLNKVLTGTEIPGQLKEVTVEKQSEGPAWGAVYAQCLEERSAVKSQGSDLSIKKMLLVEKDVNGKRQWVPLTVGDVLQVGDKVAVRLVVESARDMDFVQLKDDRAVCLEPVNQLSGYRWMENVGVYIAVKDASTSYFFDCLPKGMYTFHTEYYVTRKGKYAGGLASLQSAYAPEFAAHTASDTWTVK